MSKLEEAAKKYCDDVGRWQDYNPFVDGFKFALSVISDPDVGGWCDCGCCETQVSVDILKGYLQSKGGGV